MPVEKTTIQDPTHLISPETDRVRPTGNRRKLKRILHVAYVCESGHRSTDVSRGNNRRSTTSQNPKSCRYRGSNPGHTAYADALYQLDYVAWPVVEEGQMLVEKTTIQDPTHLISPETDRVRPTGNRRKLKQILHVAYVCESGHSPDLGPRSTDVSRGNHRRSTTSQNPKSCRYRGSNPGHTAYADALYQLDYVA